ncbi:biliverdin-producing heme oxygenase [Cellulosimicrobium funkei]|nr:biliverdin-producing heme oxygenase [Cellulosimicrobium funkei]
MTETPTPTLSARVRELTRADHHEAETSTFISDLMGGRRSSTDYALLLSQYEHIYHQLEDSVALARVTSPAPVADLFDPALERAPFIRQDLATLLPAVGLDEAPAELPAARAYVLRIAEVEHDHARLAAHHYLRYLGDLSGGQAIGRTVSRHYGLTEEHLSMYRFVGIDKPKVYKDAYRLKLDSLGFTSEQEEAFIEEAGLGFQHNKAVFQQLDDLSRQRAGAAA